MKRLLQVDLLKALAITSVFVTHNLTADQLQTASAFTIEQAVPVFFLLMAFNAKQSLDRTSSAASLGEIYLSGYLPRRCKRLLGPLFLAVVLSVALGSVSGLRSSAASTCTTCLLSGYACSWWRLGSRGFPRGAAAHA